MRLTASQKAQLKQMVEHAGFSHEAEYVRSRLFDDPSSEAIGKQTYHLVAKLYEAILQKAAPGLDDPTTSAKKSSRRIELARR